MKKVAELSIGLVDDRIAITGILVKNGYTVGPGKRRKTKTGKQLEYFLKVYVDDEEAGCDADDSQ